MNIEELFEKYKQISLSIIGALDNDEIKQLDNLLLERGEILKEISKKNETKEELKRLYEKYYLNKIDEDMKQNFEASLNEVRQEIMKNKKRREASNVYNKINARAIYLSKKI